MQKIAAKPYPILRPLKAYSVVNRELVECWSGGVCEGTFPVVHMDADKEEDIHQVYCTTKEDWLADPDYMIIPSAQVPNVAVRTLTGAESLFIGHEASRQLAYIKSDSMKVHFDQGAQRPQIVFRNRKPLINLPTSIDVPPFGLITIGFELLPQQQREVQFRSAPNPQV
jgi:hypothetical protein